MGDGDLKKMIKGELEKFRDPWLKELSSYEISKKDYEKADNNLTKKFGKKATVSDIIWSLFNEVIIKNINDFQKQYHVYFLMGNFIRVEGKNDPNQYFEQSMRALLRNYKKNGAKKVRFLASLGERTCKSCLKLNNKIFDIEKALKNPLIPNKKCKNKDENGYLHCRCAFISVNEENKNN